MLNMLRAHAIHPQSVCLYAHPYQYIMTNIRYFRANIQIYMHYGLTHGPLPMFGCLILMSTTCCESRLD